uniref:Uncharacterized protein n=1 Tax=Arundo donax TaxID=35708 RepID=A0A0A9CNF7_ARUDO
MAISVYGSREDPITLILKLKFLHPLVLPAFRKHALVLVIAISSYIFQCINCSSESDRNLNKVCSIGTLVQHKQQILRRHKGGSQ